MSKNHLVSFSLSSQKFYRLSKKPKFDEDISCCLRKCCIQPTHRMLLLSMLRRPQSEVGWVQKELWPVECRRRAKSLGQEWTRVGLRPMQLSAGHSGKLSTHRTHSPSSLGKRAEGYLHKKNKFLESKSNLSRYCQFYLFTYCQFLIRPMRRKYLVRCI